MNLTETHTHHRVIYKDETYRGSLTLPTLDSAIDFAKQQERKGYTCEIWRETLLDNWREDPRPTYLDKIKETYPRAINPDKMGGVQGCPGNYFPGAPVLWERGCPQSSPERCKACWNSPAKEENSV